MWPMSLLCASAICFRQLRTWRVARVARQWATVADMPRASSSCRALTTAESRPTAQPGDHPFTDIVVHGRDVYSLRIANLVREIAKFCDDKTRRKLADLLLFEYSEFANPDVKKLEAVLTEMRDKALQEARERGFET